MTKKREVCSIGSCTNEAAVRGVCKQCYSGMRYWVKRGLGAILHRQGRLQVLGDRLDAVSSGNVVHIQARRRRA